MKDLLLIDGDLVIDADELLMVEGPEELAQEMEITLQTNRGEFFLSPDEGLDFDIILQKKANPEAIRAAISGALAKNPRIRTINEITTEFDRKARKLNISIKATGDDDTVTVGVARDAG